MRVPCLLVGLLLAAATARNPRLAPKNKKNFLLCHDRGTPVCPSWELSPKDLNNDAYIVSNEYKSCGISDLQPMPDNKYVYMISSIKPEEPYRLVTCKVVYIVNAIKPISKQNQKRMKRQRRSLRGRFRGQTQSQYLNIEQNKGNGDEGKAEAHSAADTSRAIVSGRSGMGQAQSQTMYDPSCDDCYNENIPQSLKDRDHLNTWTGSSNGHGPQAPPNFGRTDAHQRSPTPVGVNSDRHPGYSPGSLDANGKKPYYHQNVNGAFTPGLVPGYTGSGPYPNGDRQSGLPGSTDLNGLTPNIFRPGQDGSLNIPSSHDKNGISPPGIRGYNRYGPEGTLQGGHTSQPGSTLPVGQKPQHGVNLPDGYTPQPGGVLLGGHTSHPGGIPPGSYKQEREGALPGELLTGGHAPQPGGTLPGGYIQQPGETLQGGYIPHAGGTLPGGYIQQPGGTLQGGQIPQAGGTLPGGYIQQPGGTLHGGQIPQAGGLLPGGYIQQPGGTLQGGQIPQAGGTLPGGYIQQPGGTLQGGRTPQSGGKFPGGHSHQPGDINTGGYTPQSGGTFPRGSLPGSFKQQSEESPGTNKAVGSLSQPGTPGYNDQGTNGRYPTGSGTIQTGIPGYAYDNELIPTDNSRYNQPGRTTVPNVSGRGNIQPGTQIWTPGYNGNIPNDGNIRNPYDTTALQTGGTMNIGKPGMVTTDANGNTYICCPIDPHQFNFPTGGRGQLGPIGPGDRVYQGNQKYDPGELRHPGSTGSDGQNYQGPHTTGWQPSGIPTGPGNYRPDQHGQVSHGTDGRNQFIPGGQGTYPPGGHGTYGPGGQSTYSPGGRGTYGPGGQGTYGPGGQGTYGPGGQGTYGPGGQGTYDPVKQGTYDPVKQGTYGPGGPELYGPGVRGSDGPRGQGTYGPGGREDYRPGGQVNYGPGGQGTYGPDEHGSYGPGAQGTYAPDGQGARSPGAQGTYAPGGQGARSPGGQGTYGPGSQGNERPVGQGPYGPGVQGTYVPGGQATYGPGGQATYGPGGQTTYGPGGQGPYVPAGQGAEGVYRPGGQNAYGPGGQGGELPVGGQGGQSTYGPEGQNNLGSSGHHIIGPGGPSPLGTGGHGSYETGGRAPMGTEGSYGTGGQSIFTPSGQSDYGTKGQGSYGPGDITGSGPGIQTGYGPGEQKSYIPGQVPVGGESALGGHKSYVPEGQGDYSPGAQGGRGTYGPGGQPSIGLGVRGPSGQGSYGPEGPYGPGGQGNYGPGVQGTYTGIGGGKIGTDGTNVQLGQTSGQGGVPQNVLDPNSIVSDDDSEALASVNQGGNGTIASASSKGGNEKGRAQTQVQGTYSGSGSFSAQAQITDDSKGAESQVTGSKEGASSSAQGRGRNNKSQAQVELGSETGSLQTQAQSEGVMHSSNSQVQGSVKGGMADAQARGPGSTSSQAQIGFTPYKEGDKSHEQIKSPFYGGGTASAQSSGRTGQSQSQLQGTFKYGIQYNGAAQAGASIDKDTIFPNRLPFNKIDVFDESNKNINVNLPTIDTSTPVEDETTNPEKKEHTDTKIDGHSHSEHHNGVTQSPINSRRSFQYNHERDNEYTTSKFDNTSEDYDVDAPFGTEGVDAEYTNYDDFNHDLTHQPIQSAHKKGLDIKQNNGGSTQHIVLGSLRGHNAEIIQHSSEQRPDESRIYQPGERVPGTGGYTIPLGFTGSVKSVASKSKTYAIGSRDSPSQAQTVALTPGTGKVKYVYSKPSPVNPKDLKSLLLPKKDDDNRRYMSVSKSVSGALDGDNNIKKQYSHTYYTKSSSCGYFTFTCTIVSGSDGRKKVCKPKIPTNPDGTPMNC